MTQWRSSAEPLHNPVVTPMPEGRTQVTEDQECRDTRIADVNEDRAPGERDEATDERTEDYGTGRLG
jgi:hypothetical protein